MNNNKSPGQRIFTQMFQITLVWNYWIQLVSIPEEVNNVTPNLKRVPTEIKKQTTGSLALVKKGKKVRRNYNRASDFIHKCYIADVLMQPL